MIIYIYIYVRHISIFKLNSIIEINEVTKNLFAIIWWLVFVSFAHLGGFHDDDYTNLRFCGTFTTVFA